MQNKHKLLGAVVLMASSTTQSYAVLSNGSTLNFEPGVVTTSVYGSDFVKSGSYFGMDTNGNSAVTSNERTALTQNDGIILGTAQGASGSHNGAPNGSETEGIGKAWGFFGNTGLHYTSTAANVLTATGNTATVDLSGWVVTWNFIDPIPMSSRAWEADFTDGVAQVTCGVDCGDGDTYTLDYSATVPNGDPSGFGNVKYTLHYVGTITVPNTAPTARTVSISNIAAASHSWTPDASDAETATSSLVCSIVGTPASNGIAVVGAGGDCSLAGTYTPTAAAGFTGTDSFTYRVTDAGGLTSDATVDVVISTDPAPVCNNIGNVSANSGETTTGIALNVGSNCTVSLGTPAIPTTVAVSAASAQGGAVTVNTSTQEATYTPLFGFSGVDTFTYTVSDSASASSPATVTVTVNAKSGAPTSSTDTVSCGTTAVSAGATDCIIATTNIGVADTGSNAKQGIVSSCIGGCFDFIVTGVTGDAQVILALSTPIPAPANGNSIVYRKLTTAGWADFDNSGTNAIDTTTGTVSGSNVICPPASDTAYALSPGLTLGDSCVRLTITDGGPNDDDGLPNGTVIDPSGIAETTIIDTRTSSTDGCSMTGTTRNANNHADWWLVSAFIGLLGWFSLKRKQA